MSVPAAITLDMMRRELYCAVVSDALDALGFPHQSPRVPLTHFAGGGLLVGRCKTTLWADMAHVDPKPYELELIAVDACRPDDVLIAMPPPKEQNQEPFSEQELALLRDIGQAMRSSSSTSRSSAPCVPADLRDT